MGGKGRSREHLRNRSIQGQPGQKVITIHRQADVKLHHVENAWKRSLKTEEVADQSDETEVDGLCISEILHKQIFNAISGVMPVKIFLPQLNVRDKSTCSATMFSIVYRCSMLCSD